MARHKAELNEANKIAVGDGMTYSIGTDRYPYTVIEVSSNGKSAIIQEDSCVMSSNGDYFGNQDWIISPNPNGPKREISLTAKKIGKNIVSFWKSKGGSSRFYLGRSKYEDPHF